MPTLTDSRIYWVRNDRQVYSYNFSTAETSFIAQTGRWINEVESDQENVVWRTENETAPSSEIYFYNGQNLLQLDNNTVHDEGISIQGDYITWLSREVDAGNNQTGSKVYTISTGASRNIQGVVTDTDGQRIIYYKFGQLMSNNNYEHIPVIEDMSTSDQMLISFPYGEITGSMFITTDMAGWTGMTGPLNQGSRQQQVYLVKPQPAAPTNLTGQSPAYEFPTLTWQGVGGINKYYVYRNNIRVGSSNSTSFTDNGLTTTGDYTYKVTAVSDENAESVPSNQVVIHYEKIVTPVAPGSLWGPAPTNQYPTMTWGTVSNAGSYRLYRDGALLTTTAQNTYTDSSVPNPGRYTYYVTAVGNTGLESEQSQDLIVDYDPVLPGGTFTGSNTIQKSKGHQFTGTATDTYSRVYRVELISGSFSLSTDDGKVVLSGCDDPVQNCSWTANPATFPTGKQTVTLRITDAAGNIFTTNRLYTIR